MRRFTIVSVMWSVFVLAVALAALRNANAYWAGGLLIVTPFFFAVNLIGAFCGDERSRARRLGVSIMGGGYFILAFFGPAELDKQSKLPTSRLLFSAHARLTASPNYLAKYYEVILASRTSATMPSQANRFAVRAKAAAEAGAFQTVGHCLFSLLAGLLGAVIAQRFERARLEAQGSETPT